MDENPHSDRNKKSLEHHDQQIEKTSLEEEYFDPSLSKKKKIVFWLYLACLLSFITVTLTLISKTIDPIQNHLSSDIFYFANQVVNQWNKGFVSNIKILNAITNPTCPDGYQYAFTYLWRGTGFGCLCSSGENTTFVLEAYCSPALIQANCTNIVSQDERNSHFWKSHSNICIKRSSVSFANEQKFDNMNKICGSSQSLVIVPQAEPCPLVNISLTNFSLQDNVYIAEDIGGILPKIYGIFNSTSPYSFYSYPVVKFAVSEDQFCLIDQDTGLSSNHMDFVLLSVPRGCADEGNYSKIDETTEYDFYSNNPSLNQLTSIKGFPDAGNWKYKLGFAPVPSWTYRCRHNLAGKYSIKKASKLLNFQISSLLKASSWIIIVCSIIIAVEIFLLSVRRLVNNSIYPVGYKQQRMPDHFWWGMSRYIVDFLSKLLIIIFSAIMTINGYFDWRWYKQVQNYGCPHGNIELINLVIKPNQSLQLLIFKYSLGILVVSLIMLLVDIFHFYYIYKNELSFYLVESHQILVNKDDIQNKKEQLDKLHDLKWLEVQNIEELQPNRNDDELRITMAQNLYGFEDLPKTASKPKKKKKIINKKLFNKQDNKEKNDDNPGGYSFDDDLFGIDHIDQPSSNVLKPTSTSTNKRSLNRKKK